MRKKISEMTLDEKRQYQCERQRAYRLRHPEKVNEWQRNNRERNNELHRKWYWNNRDRALEIKNRCLANRKSRDPEVYRIYQLARATKSYNNLRDKVFGLLGNKCLYCGFSDHRALQVDHTNGGGHQERLMLKNNATIYRRVLATNGVGYQLLCANCNWIKRHERKEHGYRRGVNA